MLEPPHVSVHHHVLVHLNVAHRLVLALEPLFVAPLPVPEEEQLPQVEPAVLEPPPQEVELKTEPVAVVRVGLDGFRNFTLDGVEQNLVRVQK